MKRFNLKRFLVGITLVALGMSAIGAALNPIGKPSLLPLMLLHVGVVSICLGITGPFRLPVVAFVVAFVTYLWAIWHLVDSGWHLTGEQGRF
jgi:hypothetical protein